LRVTHRMIADSVNHNLQRSLSRLEGFSHQLSTGKLFDQPSQNPVAAGRAMALSSAISSNEQFRLNINESRGWLEAGETALYDVLNLLQQVRQQTIYAASGAISNADRQTLASEVEGIYRQLVATANSQHVGLFIFGGHQTLTQPFRLDIDGVAQYHGDDGFRRQEITAHHELVMNLNGDQAFGEGQVFEAVARAARAMRDQDLPALSGDTLAGLDQAIDLLLHNIAELGIRARRTENVDHSLFQENIALIEMRSVVEDIDIPYTVTNYQMQANAYQAALATAARIFKPSLVDFLR